MLVKIISTGQWATIASTEKSFGTTSYKLVDHNGKHIRNGNMSRFDSSQVKAA
jgi:hypothetical protein